MALRVRSRWFALALVGLIAVVASGCAGSAAKTPTVPSVNFDPKLAINVGDTGELSMVLHEVTSGPVVVPVGTVIAIVNDGQADHRLQGSIAGTPAPIFDTGTLRPGDDTTVVLSTEGQLTVTDVPTGRKIDLTVGDSACCRE